MIRKPRLLLVEDDADVRALSEQVLLGAGFDVRAVASGVEALYVLGTETEPPEVVVLDVQMPDLDGWGTLERIRADHRLRRVRVLMCTVKTVAEDEMRASSLRPDGHLSKPFTIDALEEAVHRLASLPGRRS